LITQSHPIVSENHFGEISSEEKKDIIALLPGSRKQEIAIKLPIMLEASRHFSDYRFIIAQAPGQPYELYQTFITPYQNVELSFPGQTYTLLNQATAALVTSGTATLETALFGVPQVVCYKGSAISYQIAKRLIKIKYISLVNLIMDKPVVKELIQDELTVENIVRELESILHDTQKRERIKNDYEVLKNLLQQGGNASAKAAEIIMNVIKPTSSLIA
jgi:lipid-A-disaccharide synthase